MTCGSSRSAGGGGHPQRRTEPAAPGDAIALRALTLGAVIGRNALADSANGLRGGGIALDSRAGAGPLIRAVPWLGPAAGFVMG